MNLVIIDYGAGNVQSLDFALQRLGINAILTHDPQQIETADKVIFPGVGEASSAMKALKIHHLDQLIPTLHQPVLGICLGMQLLCSHSEEGNTKGLSVFPVQVKKFYQPDHSHFKIPHMGWNTLTNTQSELFSSWQKQQAVYFVHSYFAELSPYTVAQSDYILPFSAALHKDNFYGVQFHPEKSADAGKKLLQNFLTI